MTENPWKPDLSKEDARTQWMIKLGAYGALSFLLTFFLVVGSCTMHSNTFDAERTRAEAEIERAKTERAVAESEIVAERTRSVERLISNGTEPVAARCAIEGWDRAGDPVCMIAAK